MMRICFVLILLFHTSLKAQWYEDFSDGNFHSNPVWTGDTGHFIINASGLLQLNNNGNGTSVLKTSLQYDGNSAGEWEFNIALDFSPSGSNNAVVYIIGNDSGNILDGDGLFLQFGEAGSGDAITLIFSQAGQQTVLCRDQDSSIAVSFDVTVKITRDSSGWWRLYSNSTGGHVRLRDSTLFPNVVAGNSLGIICRYTSSNATRFFFDDFYAGPIRIDTTAPNADTVFVWNDSTLVVSFSEPVFPSLSNTSQHFLLEGSSPDSTWQVSLAPHQVFLYFGDGFIEQQYDLYIQGIPDGAGNILLYDTIRFQFIKPEQAEYRSVVFNELMVDPEPPVALPAAEFIEIYNASNLTVNLKDWKLIDALDTTEFPEYIFFSGTFLILTSGSAKNQFAAYGAVIGLTNFPSLSNSGEKLELRDADDKLIDRITYNSSWYKDQEKSNGGWTLEQRDPKLRCSFSDHWEASRDPRGGTPGISNSLLPSKLPVASPLVEKAYVVGSDSVIIVCNTWLDSEATLQAHCSIEHGPLVNMINANGKNIHLKLSDSLSAGRQYKLILSSLTNCNGQYVSDVELVVIRPDSARAIDFVINEILFNPPTGGCDFVELYNRSGKYLTLWNWRLANIKEDTLSDENLIAGEEILILPEAYVVLTTDTHRIKMDYPFHGPGPFFQMSSFPGYNNDQGTVILLASDSISDRVDYDEKMHFSLLDEFKGISLERVQVDLPSQMRNNWHSAAESAGFATPGKENSQSTHYPANSTVFEVDPPVFSPDLDGYQDLIRFSYRMPLPGMVATLTIFDERGNPVLSLARNELLGSSGSWIWDGTLPSGSKAAAGLYFAGFNAFAMGGLVVKERRVFVLAFRM